jgi:hypothetical protein
MLLFVGAEWTLAIKLEEKYWVAKEEWQQHEAQFEELEELLKEYDANLIHKYRAEYQRRGGEQFRPDKDKVKCKC